MRPRWRSPRARRRQQYSPHELQVVTTRRLPGQRSPEGITWLSAWDVPLPENPPDPVAFGPPLVADPTGWRGKQDNSD